MTYDQIRPEIKSGDLLAFSHGDWHSISGIKTEVVRIATRSTYSHVGIAWVVGGRVFVLEAVKPMLRIFPLSKSGDFYLLPMDVEWTPEAETFALAQVGELYSERNAIRAFFSALQPGTVNECAAFVREVYKKMDVYLGELSRPDSVVEAAQDLGAVLIKVQNGGHV